MNIDNIKNITVCGAGTMGHGIAQVCAQNCFSVRLYDIKEEFIHRGKTNIIKNLDKGILRGKVTEEEKTQCVNNLIFTTNLEEACKNSHLIIEAIPEKIDLKHALLKQVESFVSANSIIGTNTSSISISKIASVLQNPQRVIGMHFFNPVHIMQLLELVVGEETSEQTLNTSKEFSLKINKISIKVKDIPGFATSRLGVALGMEAIRMVEDGVASPEDIDTAMVLGYRHPVGPLKLTDMVGLDVRMNIGTYLAKELNNPAFEPPQLMKDMVMRGTLGKKSGQGFYNWKK